MPTLTGAMAVVLLVGAGLAPAHAAAIAPQRSVEWSWDAWVLASLAVAAVWYATGALRLLRRVGAGRVVGWFEHGTFAAGLATIFIALESPIDSISDQLFSVHMLQHLMLMLVAAPLLVFGRPAIVCLWAFGPAGRKRLGRLWRGSGLSSAMRAIMHPLAVWLLFYFTFIIWHFPGPYQAALRNEGIHAGEHLSLLVTSLMFWSIVIEPSGRRRLGYGATLVYVIKTAVLSALPGALLALAQRPLYPIYAGGAAAWGLTQLEDQQLAGAVMWIGGGFVWVLAAGLVFVRWMESAERRARLLAPACRTALPLLALCCLPLLLGGCSRKDPPSGAAIGDARQGAAVIRAKGCGGCHTIPGIVNADGEVGPPLNGIGRRIYIAGVLRNTPDNMILWLRHPQRVVPGNVMPDMGLSRTQARDVAAYLYTLR